ncbi:NAD(P)/FAD-dependent oxidoreductase [Sneathiella chinensis]|uniref:NAD(P)/FAD-dependent oxidoreductase n=1 Tax=Sneathiella chinensis TaxID=349750 RepID=UPI00146E59EB|nr:FAD-dependent oxidoreductase [Sneathiella chinensis]
MNSRTGRDVVVVGAGIIGVCTAYALQRQGMSVRLVDRKGPCAGASFGNSGAVVDGSSVPNAMPGLWKTVPKMLLDPTGPLVLRWKYLPEIAPWLFRFLMEGRKDKVRHNATSLKALTDTAAADWEELAQDAGVQDLIRPVGWLKVYETEAGFRDTVAARMLMREVGTDFDVLTAPEIHDLEPNLAPLFSRGIFQKQARFVINPEDMVLRLAEAFRQEGGEIILSDIRSLTAKPGKVTLNGSAGTLTAEAAVLAAGAWSERLARQLGDRIPLETERGYHLMFPEQAAGLLTRPVVYGEKSFVLSPMKMGIRLGSQVEFAGLEGEADFRRVRKLVPLARKMLPALAGDEQSVWLGYRPSLPDSLPVISPSTRHGNVVYAFGHQHLGLTLGPTSARLVCDLLMGAEPPIPLWPYRANRFT